MQTPPEGFIDVKFVLRTSEGPACLPARLETSVVPVRAPIYHVPRHSRRNDSSCVSCSSRPSCSLSRVQRSRYLLSESSPSYSGYFTIANLFTRFNVIFSLWPLIRPVDSSTNERCSSHAQPLLIFFPTYTHASSRNAYEKGEERVECPRTICELRWKMFGVENVEEREL